MNISAFIAACLLLILCCALPAAAASESVELTLAEHLGLRWERQMVGYPLSFPEGACRAGSIQLTDKSGQSVPCQLSAVTYWGSGQTWLKSARVHFLTELAPYEKKSFTVNYGTSAIKADKPVSDLTVQSEDTATIIENVKMGVKLASGKRSYPTPTLSVEVPAPIQAVKGSDGRWRGRGYLDTYWRVTKYESQVVAQGPVFTEVKTTYTFERNKTYSVTVRLVSGADYAQVSEDMNLGPRSLFVFDCSVGFQPDRMGLLTSGTDMMERELRFTDDQRQARFSCFTQYSQLHDFRDGIGAYESGESKDFIGAFIDHPGQWTRVKASFVEFWEHRQLDDDYLTRDRLTDYGKADAFPGGERIPGQGHSAYQGHFTWEFQLADGHRAWCLTATDKAAQFSKNETARMRLQVNQVTASPLDAVKDWTLDWPASAQTAAPAVAAEGHGVNKDSIIGLLRGYVEGFFYRQGWSCISAVPIRGIAPSTTRYLQLRAQGAFTPEEDRKVRAWYAYLCYLLQSSDYYPWDKGMRPYDDPESTEPLYAGMLNQNFNTDRYNAVGAISLTFPDHPQGKAWVDHFRQQFDAQLGFYLYPESGCWEESHTYANHVMQTLLPTLHRLRNEQKVDLFTDPRLKKMFDFFALTVTPKDLNYNSRITPAFGDHEEGNNYREIYRQAADGFNATDPAFAGRMMWLYREMGGTAESNIVATPQQLGSVALQGFGAILRAPNAAGEETYLGLRCGESWGHHHGDDNSIQLWAHGISLIGDAGMGCRRVDEEAKYSAWGHSRIIPHGTDLVNYLGKGHRGWVKQAVFGAQADYVLGYTPFTESLAPRNNGNPAPVTPLHPGYHDRQIVFVRPDFFVVRDTVRTEIYEEDFNLHLNVASVERTGDCFTGKSSFGPELDIHFLLPERPQATIIPMIFTERWAAASSTQQLKITARPDTDFLYVLNPRAKDEAPAQVKPISSGRTIIGVRVTRGDRTDIVFLTREPVEYRDGDLSFSGRAGLVTLQNGKATVTLLDGKMIGNKEERVEK